MGEKAMITIAEKLRAGEPTETIPGTCCISKNKPAGFVELPGFENVSVNKDAFESMYTLFASTVNTNSAGLVQRHGDRYLVHNPAQVPLSAKELDNIYSLPFERDVHPHCAAHGNVRAMDTIKFSITSHRGCFGGCNFCSIALHQGRKVISRSIASIESEARSIASRPDFKGIISDVGGPTANMYAIACIKKKQHTACANRACLFPDACTALLLDHAKQIHLLRKLRKISGVKKIFIASGIRFDLILADKKSGKDYLKEILNYHISGQMKIAPEHCVASVLCAMGKPPSADLGKFRALFKKLNADTGKKQFLTYYFIAAHPGCTLRDMQALKNYASRELQLNPEQIQIFTPTPSTYSTLMYYTGRNPFTKKTLFVERDMRRKQLQKDAITIGRSNKHQRKNKALNARRKKCPAD
jgi:uncharacterized radical SAM protein YgiQ